MRKPVLARWRGTTNRRQRTESQSQDVANVIEAETVRHLGTNQTVQMTSRTNGSGLGFAPRGSRHLLHQMVGNQNAKLPQKRKLTGGWLVPSLIFHALPCGKAQTLNLTFFYPSTLNPMGLL